MGGVGWKIKKKKTIIGEGGRVLGTQVYKNAFFQSLLNVKKFVVKKSCIAVSKMEPLF